MIDYVLGEREVRERVKRMRVEDRIDSDHQSVDKEGRGKKKKE